MLHDFFGLFAEPLFKALGSCRQPHLVDAAIEQIRVPNVPEVLQGVILIQVVSTRSYSGHHVEGQGFVTHRHPAHELLDHVQDLVDQHHKGWGGQRAMIQPASGIVHQVGASEG